jgi:preprotein translocase subunit SecD
MQDELLMTGSIRRLRSCVFVILLLLMSIAAAESQQLVLDVAGAAVTRNTNGKIASVIITFTPESRSAFAKFTAEYVGRRVEVRSVEHVLTTALLVSPITVGQIQIVPEKNEEDTAELARKLSSPGEKIEVRVLAK